MKKKFRGYKPPMGNIEYITFKLTEKYTKELNEKLLEIIGIPKHLINDEKV